MKVEEKVEKSMLSSKSIVGQMKGGGSTKLTSPSDTGRSNFYTEAMHGAYQPKAVAPAAPAAKVVTKPTKLTGLDRIKAAASQPITKDEGETKPAPKISKLTTAMPKLKEGFLAHPGAYTRPQPLGPTSTLHPTGTGAAVRGTAEPTHNIRSPNAVTQPAIRGTAEVTQPAKSAPGAHGAIPVRAPKSLIRKDEVGPKFEKTINSSTDPEVNNVAKGCSEKLSLNKNGQWDIK